MATLPTHEDTHATEKTVPKPGPGLVAPHPDMLLAMLACDHIVGDKHYYAAIRAAAIRLLTGMADPEAKAALARLEGMSGAAPPVVAAPTAKAA
jgi:hypothetical protein